MSDCTTTQAVQFNYSLWVERYPEFESVSEPLALLYWNEASLYCANVLRLVCNPASLTVLLNMLTAHVAQLSAPGLSGQTGLVGRISSASQGSVNVSVDMPNQPQAAAWYQQTPYGAAFWAATAPYRTMRYLPGLQRSRRATVPGPFGLYRRWN